MTATPISLQESDNPTISAQWRAARDLTKVSQRATIRSKEEQHQARGLPRVFHDSSLCGLQAESRTRPKAGRLDSLR